MDVLPLERKHGSSSSEEESGIWKKFNSTAATEEEAVADLIQKLKAVDFCHYIFQRDNLFNSPFYSSPGLAEFIFREHYARHFALFENLTASPVEGVDLERLNTRHFTHDQMLQITGGFSQDHLIRRSFCGRQFRGQIIADGLPQQDVVVKRWDFYFPIRGALKGRSDCFYRQLEFLLNQDVPSHPNMARLMGFCCDKILALVWDLKLNKTLDSRIPEVSFSWSRRLKVAWQVAETLYFFHKKHIALCNIFAPCINVDKDDNIKLFEFDCATNLANGKFAVEKRIVGNWRFYYSPECLSDTSPESFFTTDIYQFGLLLLELALAKCADKTDGWAEWAMSQIEKGEGYLSNKISITPSQNAIFDLAVKCVQKDLKVRPKIDEVVEKLKLLRN